MTLIVKIFLAAVFIVTGGSVFSEKYKKYKPLVALAGFVSILGAIYLARDVTDDIYSGKKHQSYAEKDNAYKCEESYLVIQKNDTQCDFVLSENNELIYKNETIGRKLIVTQSSENTVIPANLLVVYPQSNSRRFAFVQLCEFQENDKNNYGLCWTSFVFDKKNKIIKETYAGKYGPERWIKWAVDDKYFVLASTNEGANWIHAIEAETGKSYEFPHHTPSSSFDAYEMAQIQKDTFTWIGPRTFEIKFSYKHYDPKDYNVLDKGTKTFSLDITSKGLLGGVL